MYNSIRDQYAEAIGYEISQAASSGESFEHFYNRCGSVAFLTEIGTEFHPPTNKISSIVRKLRPGWQYLLSRGLGPAIQGHVTNALTGAPMPEARISIEGIEFSEGEIRQPEPHFGRYQWVLLPGAYTVTFTAPGFQPQSHTVTVTDQAVSLDVNLMPLAALSVVRGPSSVAADQ
jgi:hypothetical protein